MDAFTDLSILPWNSRSVLNWKGKYETRVLIRHHRLLLLTTLETRLMISIRNYPLLLET